VAVFYFYKAGIWDMRWLFLLFLIVPCVAHAVCAPGYYLDNDECKVCSISGYYCPGDDSMIRCPTDTTDWIAVYTNKGYTVYNVTEPHLWSASNPFGNITDCHTRVYVTVTGGTFHIEPIFDGSPYNTNYQQLWTRANTGYYLSPYRSTSWDIWYDGVKPCTNAPANAHYTGPGTPDAPDGSVRDANDCPWECNDGYGRHNDECVPLCSTARYIKTETGLSFNLYSAAYSTPRLALQHKGIVCYGILAPGQAQNTINISYNGAIYHMEN